MKLFRMEFYFLDLSLEENDNRDSLGHEALE